MQSFLGDSSRKYSRLHHFNDTKSDIKNDLCLNQKASFKLCTNFLLF
jgi:hypothetical protein